MAGAGSEPAAGWRVTPGHRLLIRDWDDGESVVYDATSGNTHVIGELAAHVLRRLMDVPTTSASALAHALSDQFDAPGDNLAMQVDRSLLALRGIGLVTRAPL